MGRKKSRLPPPSTRLLLRLRNAPLVRRTQASLLLLAARHVILHLRVHAGTEAPRPFPIRTQGTQGRASEATHVVLHLGGEG
jgi:hypothetical protein